MRCYRCNSVLSDADICESCGTDVVIYKKSLKCLTPIIIWVLQRQRSGICQEQPIY